MKQRILYGSIILISIFAGLLSRKASQVPAAAGDLLYAFMMFFIVRFIFMRFRGIYIAGLSLGICFAIEFSQLYRAAWIIKLRQTLPGRLILGQGFLWTDLVAYMLGVTIAMIVDAFATHKRLRQTGAK